MTAAQVGEVAGNTPSKAVHNWTERGLIDCKTEKIKTRSRRLYSLASALQAWVLNDAAASGTSREVAAQLAAVFVERAKDHMEAGLDITADDTAGEFQVFAYRVSKVRGEDKVTGQFLSARRPMADLFHGAGVVPGTGDVRIVDADYLIARAAEIYAQLKESRRKGDSPSA